MPMVITINQLCGALFLVGCVGYVLGLFTISLLRSSRMADDHADALERAWRQS